MEGIRLAFIVEKNIDKLNEKEIDYTTVTLNNKTYTIVYWYFDTSNYKDIKTDLSKEDIELLKELAEKIVEI